MDKFKVLMTRRVPESGIELLAPACELRLWTEDRPAPPAWLLEHAPGVDGIVCLLADRVDAALIQAAGPSLKAIATMAVGYDNIDLAEASRRGVLVGNTPDVLTEATADLTWALLLALARNIVPGDRMVRDGRFNGWSPTLLVGADLHKKTLGVVGMGRIGRAVARRAQGFEMEVIYYNRHRLAPELEAAIPARLATLPELLATADFVSLHCPLNRESYHLIGPDQIARMKPTALLLNVARGPVVDEAALVDALKRRQIAGAAFDVYEREPLLTPGLDRLENVVLAPHLGSASAHTRDLMAQMTAQNLLAGMRGQTPPWCVNPNLVRE